MSAAAKAREMPADGGSQSIIERIDEALNRLGVVPVVDEQAETKRQRLSKIHSGHYYYNDTNYELQVGDGVSCPSKHSKLGVIHLITRDMRGTGQHYAVVKWRDGSQTIHAVDNLVYMPTPEQIEATKREIQQSWTATDERTRNNYKVQEVDICSPLSATNAEHRRLLGSERK